MCALHSVLLATSLVLSLPQLFVVHRTANDESWERLGTRLLYILSQLVEVKAYHD